MGNIPALMHHKAKLILVGLDGSGKSSIMFRMTHHEFLKTIPTISYNLDTFKLNDAYEFNLYDMGGIAVLRTQWLDQVKDARGVVFVVDSHDETRLMEADQAIHALLGDPHLKHIPVLVLANKQDLPSSLNQAAVKQMLHLETLPQNTIHIQPCSAQQNAGIADGMKWLGQQIWHKKFNVSI